MTVSEHGAGDSQEPVGDGAESACMCVTTASQGGVFGAAGLVVLHGDACPVVDGVRETRMAGVAPDDDPALAGSLGDGRHSCQTSQGGVVAPLQRIACFCGDYQEFRVRPGC